MVKRNYDRSIELNCPTCGCTQFEHEGEDYDSAKSIKCASCQLEFSKDDIIEGNSENISKHAEEISQEVFEDLQKQMKNIFKGNNFIKVK